MIMLSLNRILLIFRTLRSVHINLGLSSMRQIKVRYILYAYWPIKWIHALHMIFPKRSHFVFRSDMGTILQNNR